MRFLKEASRHDRIAATFGLHASLSISNDARRLLRLPKGWTPASTST